MENQELDIPQGFEHLFPQPQLVGKKRSSILKQLDANTDYGKDERRSMKRVSFAQHTFYQEVFPDGTINCMEKQLKAERLITGSDLENENAREINSTVTEEKSVLERNDSRKTKIATAFKNHMGRNYNVNNDKDYDTLYNTSVNKYGREIIPRDEKGDVEKLFNDVNGSMHIDGQHSITLNVSKAFSTEYTGSQMSLVDSKFTLDSASAMTNIFECKSMEITENHSFEKLDTSESEQLLNKSFSLPLIDLPEDQSCESFEQNDNVNVQTETTASVMKCTEETKNENERSKEVAAITSVTSSTQDNFEAKVSEECCDVDMECSSSNDTDTCSESNFESDDSTKLFADDTMDVCSADCVPSIEIETKTYDKESLLNDPSFCTQSKVFESKFTASSSGTATPAKDCNVCVMTADVLEVPTNFDDKLPIALQMESTNDVSVIVNNIVQETIDAVCDQKESSTSYFGEHLVHNRKEATNGDFNDNTSESNEVAIIVSSTNSSSMNQTMNKTQAPKLTFLSKIQLPVSTAVPMEKSCIEVCRNDAPPTFSFIIPTSETKTFNFKAQKHFKRVSCIPKATINILSRMSLNNLSPTNDENEIIDNRIENDWQTQDVIETQLNKTAETHSFRPRLRKSFGVSIHEKLRRKREEIENKRNNLTSETDRCNIAEQPIVQVPLEETCKNTECVQETTIAKQDSILSHSNVSTLSVKKVDTPNEKFADFINCDIGEHDVTSVAKFDKFEKSTYLTPEVKHNTKRKRCSIQNSENESLAECTNTKMVKVLDDTTILQEDENTVKNKEASSHVSVELNWLSESSSIKESENTGSNDGSLYDAFENECSMNSSLNPFQFSFINKDDTLFLMAEELEQTLDEVTLPNKSSCSLRKSAVEVKYPAHLACLEKLDKQWMSDNNIKLQDVSEQKVSVAFLSGIFVLEIHLQEDNLSPKNEVQLKLLFHFDSKVKAEGFIGLRNDFIFDIRDKHKGLLIPVNFMVASLFDDVKTEIVNNCQSVDQVINEVSKIMIRGEQLLMELRLLSAFHKFRFRQVENNFEFVFLIRGICRNMYLVLSLNVQQYPNSVVKPTFGIHVSERHRYPLKSFTEALQEVPTGEKYIARLVKSAKAFVKAIKKVEIENKKVTIQRT